MVLNLENSFLFKLEILNSLASLIFCCTFCQPQAKAKAKAMPGRLYIHTGIIIIKNTFVSYLNSPGKGCPRGTTICV